MSKAVGLAALSAIFTGFVACTNAPSQAATKSLIVHTASGSVRGHLAQEVYRP